jgi:hypothetical protein
MSSNAAHIIEQEEESFIMSGMTIHKKKKKHKWNFELNQFQIDYKNYSYTDIESIKFTQMVYNGVPQIEFKLFLKDKTKVNFTGFFGDIEVRFEGQESEHHKKLNIDILSALVMFILVRTAELNPEAKLTKGSKPAYLMGLLFVVATIPVFIAVGMKQGFVVETFTFLGLAIPGIGLMSLKPATFPLQEYFKVEQEAA